jgi:basic membrane protein A
MAMKLLGVTAVAMVLSFAGCSTADRVTTSQTGTDSTSSKGEVKAESVSHSAAKAAPLKIAFVYVGPVGNAGWSYAHDQGRLALEAALGDRIQTTYLENVPEFDEQGTVFRKLARQGNQLIFGTTFGYMEPIQVAARAYPDVKFENAEGFKRATNVRTYAARTYESAYLAGILAGSMTRSNRIGFVGSIPMPEMISVINAYTLGARSVNPKVHTSVVWANSWFNPPIEDRAARSLISSGADILFQSTDSGAVIQAAQSLGKRAIGWDSDMKQFGPRAHLASAVLNWGPYYIKTVQDALSNQWQSTSSWWGIKENTVDLVNIADDVPAPVRDRLAVAKESLYRDSFFFWRGPLEDNLGRMILRSGESPSTELVAAHELLR